MEHKVQGIKEDAPELTKAIRREEDIRKKMSEEDTLIKRMPMDLRKGGLR